MILAGRKVNESMPSFIANTCVSEMAKKNIDPNSAKIAILGLTFKENCPDLRNTKVVNIFYELNKFTDLIQAYDPYAKKSEVKAKFGIDISNIDKITPVDVVVIAVAHDEYKSLSLDSWKKIIKPNGIIIDVKSAYHPDFFINENILHWRL